MYKRSSVLLILLVITLTSCFSEKDVLTINEVKAALKKNGLKLEVGKENPGSVFQMRLNGVTPEVYTLNGKAISIYIFSSEQAREAGWEEFLKKTATANLLSYEVYQANNIFILYVYEKTPLDPTIDIKLKRASSILADADKSYVYWTTNTNNQIQRLEAADVEYEIREDEIWVREEDMEKVLACCS
jgi:hypothetical protein